MHTPTYISADEQQVIEEQEIKAEYAHDDVRYEKELIDETDPLHSTKAYFERLKRGAL